MSDIVTDILQRVTEGLAARHGTQAANDGTFLREVEAAIRRDWGGERPYVAKAGESADLHRIRRDIEIRRLSRMGNSPQIIAKRMAMSDRRVRQILAE
jgi:hypothetical protein